MVWNVKHYYYMLKEFTLVTEGKCVDLKVFQEKVDIILRTK